MNERYRWNWIELLLFLGTCPIRMCSRHITRTIWPRGFWEIRVEVRRRRGPWFLCSRQSVDISSHPSWRVCLMICESPRRRLKNTARIRSH